jgi:hypothetical protein
MSVPTTDRLVALARRHETVADMALAAGILLISVIDAVAEQPHPAKLVSFSVAITLPLVWRRRSPVWAFAALAVICPSSACAIASRSWWSPTRPA